MCACVDTNCCTTTSTRGLVASCHYAASVSQLAAEAVGGGSRKQIQKQRMLGAVHCVPRHAGW